MCLLRTQYSLILFGKPSVPSIVYLLHCAVPREKVPCCLWPAMRDRPRPLVTPCTPTCRAVPICSTSSRIFPNQEPVLLPGGYLPYLPITHSTQYTPVQDQSGAAQQFRLDPPTRPIVTEVARYVLCSRLEYRSIPACQHASMVMSNAATSRLLRLLPAWRTAPPVHEGPFLLELTSRRWHAAR